MQGKAVCDESATTSQHSNKHESRLINGSKPNQLMNPQTHTPTQKGRAAPEAANETRDMVAEYHEPILADKQTCDGCEGWLSKGKQPYASLGEFMFCRRCLEAGQTEIDLRLKKRAESLEALARRGRDAGIQALELRRLIGRIKLPELPPKDQLPDREEELPF